MKNFLSLAKDIKTSSIITSVALGKFEGIHIAHFEVFKALDSQGIILSIEGETTYSFSSKLGELLPKKYRQFFTNHPIYQLSLNLVREKSDKEFLDFLLSILPNLQKIVVGYDFRFGKDRAYYPFDLQKYFKGEVFVVSEVSYKKLSVHSGLIKQLLINGNLKQANKLLGRFFEIRGEIIRGQGIGKKELFATINIQNDGFLLPQEGVYAGYVQLGKQSHITLKHPAVIFLGNRISTDKSFAIEAHLLNQVIDTNEKEAGFYFCKKIRDNAYFSDLSSLKEQISKDIQKACKILKIQNVGM